MAEQDALVTRLINGDRGAWQDLYVTYKSRMRAAARRRLRDERDQEEAVLDAFQAVHTGGLERLKAVNDLGAYLAGITTNKAIDIARRNERQVATVDEKHARRRAADLIDPETAAVNADALRIGYDLLDQMDEKVAYALWERGFCLRPAKDVAVELGCDPSNISKLVEKGLAFLDEHSPFINRNDADYAPAAPTTQDLP